MTDLGRYGIECTVYTDHSSEQIDSDLKELYEAGKRPVLLSGIEESRSSSVGGAQVRVKWDDLPEVSAMARTVMR